MISVQHERPYVIRTIYYSLLKFPPRVLVTSIRCIFNAKFLCCRGAKFSVMKKRGPPHGADKQPGQA